MIDQPAFEYRDEDGDRLTVRPTIGTPAPAILLHISPSNCARVPLDHVEEVVAGIRDAARQAGGQPTGIPQAEYSSVWPELVGWVQAAHEDGEQIDPEQLLEYMRELKRRALAPIRQWMDSIRGAAAQASGPHRPPCVDGDHCGEAAHCPPTVSATEIQDDARQTARQPSAEETPRLVVKEATRRYAEQLRATPGKASADGHTGWECAAGASLIAEATTPGPGRLGTLHATIYTCPSHRTAAEERITAGGYTPLVDDAPPGHRWDPWPCGHVTAYESGALDVLSAAPAPATKICGDTETDDKGNPLIQHINRYLDWAHSPGGGRISLAPDGADAHRDEPLPEGKDFAAGRGDAQPTTAARQDLEVLMQRGPIIGAEAGRLLDAYRAAVLREAANTLDDSETLRDLTDDHMGDVNATTNELRRMAEEDQ